MTRPNRRNQQRVSSEHKEVARVLCKWIDEHRSDKKSIGYMQLCDLVGLTRLEIGAFLGDLSRECHYLGLPLITSVVNYAGTEQPAQQFYLMAFLAGRGDLNDSNIQQEKDRVFSQDWHPFTSHLDSHAFFQQLPQIRI